jgi:hypothetical protein
MGTPVENQQVRELPIVAGHLALDFANTVDDPEGRARHDHIATYPDLVRWSLRAGAAPGARPARDDRRDLRRCRHRRPALD